MTPPSSWSANQPDAHRWVVVCDGQPVGNCWRASVAERWAEIVILGPTGVALGCKDGGPLTARFSGKVELQPRSGG